MSGLHSALSATRPLERGLKTNALGILIKASRPLYLILFSRMLGAEGFGIYLLAFAVQEFISKFAILGLNWGGKQVTGSLLASGRDAEVRSTIIAILAIAMLFSTLASLGLALGAGHVAAMLGHDALAPPLRIFAIGFPFLCGMYVLVYSFRPKLDMRYELWITSVVEPVSVLLIGAVLLQVSSQVMLLACAHVAASVIAFSAAVYLFNRIYPRAGSRGRGRIDWRMLLHGSSGMGATEILINLQSSIDLFILATFFTPQVIGVYGAAVQIVSLLRKSKAAFDPILMPLAQNLHLNKQSDRLQAEVSRAVGWAMWIGLGMLGVMVLIPDQLLGLFGEEFSSRQFGVLLTVLAVGQFFNMSLGLSEGVLSITGHAHVSLASAAALVVSEVILLYLLIPNFGLAGAAVAASLPFVGVTVWRVRQTRRLLGIRMLGRDQGRIAILFAVCLGLAMLFFALAPGGASLRATLSVIAFAICYASVFRHAHPQGQRVSHGP